MAAMTRKKNNKTKGVPLTYSELLELEEERVRELEDEQEEREREQLEMVNLKWKHFIFNQSPNPSGRRVTWGSNNIHDIHYSLSSNNNTGTTSNDSNKHDTTHSNDSNQSTQSTSNCTMQRNHTTRGRNDTLQKDPTLFRKLQLKRELKRKQKRG